MTHGNALLQHLGISGFTFGQNGGYNGNCTTDFSGVGNVTDVEFS